MNRLLARLRAIPREEKILLIAAAVPAVIINRLGQVTYLFDSHTYVINAYYLFEPLKICHYYWRSLGYPLALYLTGLRLFESHQGILLLQMLSAIAMPWLLYRTLLPLSARYAFFCALFFVVSLLPNFFQNTIYQDQLQSALGLAAAYFFSRLILEPRNVRPLLGLCIVCGVISFFRPTLMIMGVLPLLGYLHSCRHLSWREARPHTCLMLCGTIWIGLLQYGQAKLHEDIYDKCRGIGAAEYSYRMFGKQLFQNAYMYSTGLPDVFSEATGPAAARIRTALNDYMQSEQLERELLIDKDSFDRRRLLDTGLPRSEWADYMLTHPGPGFFWQIYFSHIDDKVFLQAVMEIHRRFPQIRERILVLGWKGLTFGGYGLQYDGVDVGYLYGGRHFYPVTPIIDNNFTVPPPELVEEISELRRWRAMPQKFTESFNMVWLGGFVIVAAVAFMLISFGFILWPILLVCRLLQEWRTEYRLFAALSLVMLLQLLPLVLLVAQNYRYHLDGLLMAVPTAGVMGWVVWRLIIPEKWFEKDA